MELNECACKLSAPKKIVDDQCWGKKEPKPNRHEKRGIHHSTTRMSENVVGDT
jgi:hypothetical protein